ncbi:MAG: hypothetical protein E6L00_03220 [Thaumarchaeota archaeon]|nr:MAG: hypothetical protein E6L02_01595 [Nitrososphaerota archaeon]TLX82584.1 MAG: hypothetical protein E6L00_03220 [Nitrososphaerota archaeon]
MTWDEIEVPKEIRPFMLEEAEETKLGQKNGADKQYRYGNLHIREYEDKYMVHMDKIDPRKDPLGHLVRDAPEVLIGLASAFFGGKKVASQLYKMQKNSKLAKDTSLLGGLLASLALGYLGYSLTKKIKNF